MLKDMQKAGFKNNEDKTVVINFNVDQEKLAAHYDPQYIKGPDQTNNILGYLFKTMKTGVKIDPTADLILRRLRSKYGPMIQVKQLTNDIQLIVDIARKFIYESIGELFLVKVYSSNQSTVKSIKVAINNIIRAFLVEPSQSTMNKVIGTDIDDFIDQQIIMTGIKLYTDFFEESKFDEVFNPDDFLFTKTWLETRPKNLHKNTFRAYFESCWEKLDAQERFDLVRLGKEGKVEKMKNTMKDKRKIEVSRKEMKEIFRTHRKSRRRDRENEQM